MVSTGEIVMQYKQPLKILILAAEIVPFAKVGGLADVVGALPKSLQALGHDVRLAMPRYGQIDPARFDLQTVLDAVTVNMSNFRVQVSVPRERLVRHKSTLLYLPPRQDCRTLP